MKAFENLFPRNKSHTTEFPKKNSKENDKFEISKKEEWITIDLLICLCLVIWWLVSIFGFDSINKKKKKAWHKHFA